MGKNIQNSENKSYSLSECEAYFKCRRIKEVTKHANTFLLGIFTWYNYITWAKSPSSKRVYSLGVLIQ